MDRSGERGADPGRSRGPGGEGNDDRLSDDREGEANRKVAARPSNPSRSPAHGQERSISLLQDARDPERLIDEELLGARAEDPAAAGQPSETSLPSLQLDSIWSRDLGSIDLPKYAETHNTISFPEKVSLFETSVQSM